MFFEQIKYRGDNFTYVVADATSREAAVVDPSFNLDAVIMLLKDKRLKLRYIINTHHHLDHTAGNEDLKSAFNGKIVAHESSILSKDLVVRDGDILKLGDIDIRVIATPGHTPDGICLLVDGKLLTGDTLFVGECGRTDLPGSSPGDMYRSLLKLMKLGDNIEVFPGHDYGDAPHSTIGKERMTNYTVKKRTLAEFVEFMRQP